VVIAISSCIKMAAVCTARERGRIIYANERLSMHHYGLNDFRRLEIRWNPEMGPSLAPPSIYQ